MEDQNSPKLDQEDPIVMYLIVHTTLNMSVGKLAAQVGHAASLAIFDYSDLKDESRKLQKQMASLEGEAKNVASANMQICPVSCP